MFKILLPWAAALTLGACALPALPPSASLPQDATAGAGDPLRSAAATTSMAFSDQATLAGRPAQAARAVAQMEYLAVEMPADPRLVSLSSTVLGGLETAKVEWRTALGIPATAPAQPVINSLYAAARALGSGQPEAAAAALPVAIFPRGGQATLTRLAALPPLPATNRAAVSALDAFRKPDSSPARSL